ncbi:hypothetical protein BDQ17DRAFT_1540840 [Cyathus striatus]|nr:hypothetical protein BDQ17DRAFT_1540840 [Cyathus striatus]
MSSSNSYTKLPGMDDESMQQLLPGPSDSYQPPRRLWYHTLKGLLIFNMILLLVSCILLGVSLHKGSPKITTSTNHIPVYSPALEAVEYEVVAFNGSFMYPSEYRGPPNPGVDAAWNRITKNIHPIRLSEVERLKAGIPASLSHVKFQQEDGGGYMAALESNHQLHCLNMLRKYTYREYYEPIDQMFEAKAKELRSHLDHCIEMLRQRLMCTADTGIITFHWVHGWRSPYPNFSTEHTCRNFEKIAAWNYEHAVHIDESHVTRFGDAEDLPEPP